MNLVCRLLLEKNFFNDTATTEIYTVAYTLSLHDALPILRTTAGGRWAVQREFNRRMKKRFEAEGIDIPFPVRTLLTPDLAALPAVAREQTAPDAQG